MARRCRSLLGVIFNAIIGLVLTVVLILGGIYAFIYFRYDINLVDVFGYIGTVNDEVDTTELITNPYTAEDLTSAKDEIDSISIFDTEISFTDRQMAAYINDVITNSNDESKIVIGEKEYFLRDIISIAQVKFSNIPTTPVEGDGVLTSLNLVAKLDITLIKEDVLTSFPFSIINGYVPEEIYVSSTVNVLNYDLDNAERDYSVESDDLYINNLDMADIQDIVDMINNFTDIGTAEELNEKIASIFVDALIGDSENQGLAYDLMQKGATGYSFTTDGADNYFTIYKDSVLPDLGE